MKDEKEQEQQEQQAQEQEQERENVVRVNDDPKQGPLDGAEADVFVSKTVFIDRGEGQEPEIVQTKVRGRLTASYELGVFAISIPEENIMLHARIDETMQVLFASAGANKRLHEKKEGNDDGESN